MGTINIEPKFEKNLRKLKVLTKYKKEVIKNGHKYKKGLVYNFIYHSFTMSLTEDGFDFWDDVDNKITNLNKEDKA